MTLTTASKTDPAIRLRNEAEAAWDTYASTCMTGGTPEQRKWAFDQALNAEQRATAAARGRKLTP